MPHATWPRPCSVDSTRPPPTVCALLQAVPCPDRLEFLCLCGNRVFAGQLEGETEDDAASLRAAVAIQAASHGYHARSFSRGLLDRS